MTFSAVDSNGGSAKAKLRHKTLQSLRDKMMRNTQYTTKGFGQPSGHSRPTVCDADSNGGVMSNLLSNQYEKEFIEKAVTLDKRHQVKKEQRKQRLLALINPP